MSATEHRMTITITPISEPELQAFIDAFRERFGRKHLVHVISKQSSGSHLATAPVAAEPDKLREMAKVIDEVIAHHRQYNELDETWLAETGRRLREMAGTGGTQ